MTDTQGEGREVAPLRHLGNLGIYDHMNEKAKKVLSYVACALGGAFLGIALLGGLSYCSTSSAREKADTINTIDRVRHNASGTTDGGYDYYRMEVPLRWYLANDNGCYYQTYDVDINTYDLTVIGMGGYTGAINNLSSSQSISQAILNKVALVRPTAPNSVRFLAMFGKSDIFSQGVQRKWAYFSFCLRNGDTMGILPKSFVMTTPWKGSGIKVATSGISYAWWAETNGQNYYTLTYEESDVYLWDSGLEMDAWEDQYLYFQDVVSYYSQKGYESGNSAGYTEGYEDGNQEGYDNGYQDGNEHGQAQGYEDGYINGYASGFTDGADNSLLFTKIGANQTAWSLSDIEWDVQGDTYAMMKCLDFKDGDNNTYYVEINDYTSGGGEVQIDVYKNGTSSNNFYATIGRGDYNRAYTEIDIIPSSYLEFDFAQVITYYHNAIPNNWFMLSGTPANANGYEQGYQKGFRDGQLATPTGQATNNVFSLFTSAFNAVGGIFEMKIFGFLPLYWFFLTPIFIAIITLLLRMVKH